MKYIRTKYGVYEVDENSKGNDCFLWVKTNEANIVQCVWLNCILEQADTIEELCDGVIEKCLSGNRFHYICNFNKQEGIKVMNIGIDKEFYFGIFVNHNNKIDFISVAKMNDKGEIELI